MTLHNVDENEQVFYDLLQLCIQFSTMTGSQHHPFIVQHTAMRPSTFFHETYIRGTAHVGNKLTHGSSKTASFAFKKDVGGRGHRSV